MRWPVITAFVLTASSLISCRTTAPAPRSAAPPIAPMCSREFTKLMNALPSVYESDPTPQDLRHYTSLARRLQLESHDTIEQLLGEYSVYATYQDSSTGASAKAFVLLRILFNAPYATEPTPFAPAGFRGRDRALAKGLPAGPSWPVQWVDDHAEFISPIEGRYGRPYQADADFRWFCARFALRAFPAITPNDRE